MKPKTIHTIWIIIVVLVIAGQLAYHRYSAEENPVGSGGALSDEREIAYWVAPMDPSFVSDEPGKSPMGMDLVPVYMDEINPSAGSGTTSMGNPGQVSINPVTVQNIGIRSVRSEKRTLSKKIRALGIIDYNETRISSINTKISGWAEKLYIDFTGQEVRKGDPLIDIYSPELLTTQEEYLQALNFHNYFQGAAYSEVEQHSSDLLASTRERMILWDVTDEQIAELERTKKTKKIMTIFSPISGIVTHKMINEGNRITPNMQIYEIADISTVWVKAAIYEYELPWVEIGQSVTMTLSYYPGKEFRGRITFIYPYLDSKTRTIKVRFEFENPGLLLKPEMYANVFIESTLKEPEVVVPVDAVILTGERSIVIIDLGEGRFEPREVTIGMESDNYYTILDGLNDGEKVVTSAQFLIDSESRIREAQMKMLAAKSDPSQNGKDESMKMPAGQEEEHEDMEMPVTLIGDGEMEYTCPMGDLVFSSGPAECTMCGMELKEMSSEQKENMNELIESHPVERLMEEIHQHE